LLVFKALFKIFEKARGTVPLYFIFNSLVYEADPFQNIGDVVDAALLDLEISGRLVQVNLKGWRGLDQEDKFLSEFS